MKNAVTIFLSTVSLFLIDACCKDSVCPDNQDAMNCPTMYNQRSEPYINTYKGALYIDSPIPPDITYPDKYCYYYPIVNPNNLYEIAYCRRENFVQSGADMDLYKFNFCTGKSTFITNHVAFGPDWSVKDWIIFQGQKRDIWKVKSNGDSLTQLTFSGDSKDYPKWNTTGTLFLWNNTRIANEKGELMYTIPNCGYLVGWYDSIQILNVQSTSNDMTKFNVSNGHVEHFFSQSNMFFQNYNKSRNELIGLEYVGTISKRNLLYSISENKIAYLNDTIFQSFYSNIYCQLDNKLLMQQVLRDTMTGSPEFINFRSHIAIMDRDGSNLRKVLLPE